MCIILQNLKKKVFSFRSQRQTVQSSSVDLSCLDFSKIKPTPCPQICCHLVSKLIMNATFKQ